MAYCHSARKLSFIMASCITILVCLVVLTIFGSANSLRRVPAKVESQNPEKELQLVHLVFRHGPRTPADTYPTDPYINQTFSPNGWGQLTNEGKTIMYNTGKWLRKRYDGFLGKVYLPDVVHAQATGVSRTHMTMALVLAGLWPPKNTVTEWNRGLNWQPIPIFSQALDEDTLLLVRTSCPRYYEALKEVHERPEIKSIIEANKPMMQKLSKLTGMKIETPEDVGSLYSTLKAETEFGLKLPSWTKDYYPDKLIELAELSYVYNVYTDELKKIKGGPFITKMVGEWKQMKSGELKPKDRKIFMYTGHDSTVVNILQALNVWETQYPGYGVMAMFELYKNTKTGEFAVEMYLRNSTTGNPTPLTLPGCDFHCPIDKVIELTKPMVSEAASCKAKDSTFTEPPPSGP